MNDDLISRKALKEAIRKRLCISSLQYLTEQEKVIVDEINNAPTVEPKLSDEQIEKIETYKNAYRIMSDAFENEVRKNKRPHGEWVIDGHHYKCSRCGKTLAIMFSETDDDDLIGCPFCLADMRGGAE